MSRTRISVTMSDWETLSHSVTEETMSDSPELKVFHDQLQAFLAEFQQLAQEQAFHAARKQEATRRMNEILEDGRRTASALKSGLKLRFGNRSAELVRFGVAPFRRKKRQKETGSPADAVASKAAGEPSS
jgi:hypothetical protein